jgi:hypothetical protein
LQSQLQRWLCCFIEGHARVCRARSIRLMMKLRTLTTLLLLIICMQLASCDHVYQYNYMINNTTDSQLSVRFKCPDADTLVVVAAHAVNMVFSMHHAVEGKSGPYFTEMTEQFSAFSIAQHFQSSGKNYMQKSSWDFSKSGATGVYTATVTQAEF